MRYRYYLGLGVVGIAVAIVLDQLHLNEENSPLVFGPAVLGLSAIVSPLILGAARSREGAGGFRPSGKAVLQSILIPLVGAGLTIWGLLGTVGVLPAVSFDGPLQHCKTCKTNWILMGARGERPHYVEACEHCATFPTLREEVIGMGKDLFARLASGRAAEPADPRRPIRVKSTVRMENRSPVRLELSGIEDAWRAAVVAFPDIEWGSADGVPTHELRVEVDGAGAGSAAHEHRLRLRVTLFDLEQGRPLYTVERQGTFVAEPVSR